MGGVTSLIDAALFIFFLVIALAAPLMDFQILLPRHFYPDVLLNFKAWYTQHYGDYLFLEKPHFFVAIIWLELFLQWPLSLFSLYGIASGKSWVNTTCLIFGSSTLTTMVAILSDMVWSGKASEKLMMVYVPFLGFAVLAILRGLLSHPSRTTVIGKRPVLNRKKRA